MVIQLQDDMQQGIMTRLLLRISKWKEQTVSQTAMYFKELQGKM